MNSVYLMELTGWWLLKKCFLSGRNDLYDLFCLSLQSVFFVCVCVCFVLFYFVLDWTSFREEEIPFYQRFAIWFPCSEMLGAIESLEFQDILGTSWSKSYTWLIKEVKKAWGIWAKLYSWWEKRGGSLGLVWSQVPLPLLLLLLLLENDFMWRLGDCPNDHDSCV